MTVIDSVAEKEAEIKKLEAQIINLHISEHSEPAKSILLEVLQAKWKELSKELTIIKNSVV